MMTVKDALVTVFACIFYYGVVPAFSLWGLVTVWVLCAYSVKTVLYLCTGSASIVGATGPAAIAPAFAESVAGGVLAVFVCGVYVLYRYFRLRYKMQADHMVDVRHMVPLEESTH